ncbi:MAG: site-2 protease family protein [Gemmatimonadota bacterium]
MILILAVLIFSVVAHEVAHGWQARREGDHTAERMGRLTLNPVAHLDPVGSVILPLILYLTHAGFIFGWARPVPVNPLNYRDRKWGDIRVSLAGVTVNFLLALAATLAGGAILGVQGLVGTLGGVLPTLFNASVYAIFINLILALFNLIPIPPLDGSHVVVHLLPPEAAVRYQRAGRYGILVIMGLFFLFPNFFRLLLWPVNLFMGAADAFFGLWT